LPDEVGEQLAVWGTVALIESRGRTTGQPARAAVGFVEEPDSSLLVAAGSPDADWARNLEADPQCRVTIGSRTGDYRAEALTPKDASRAVRELILRYGTPAERLGNGPAFRLVPLVPLVA
jgi:deazaflavin-dependent oxidoreductase (nitroreductase family)